MVVELNSNKQGFILLDCCVCVLLTITIALLVLSVKTLEVKHQDAWINDIQQSEEKIAESYQKRKRCEVECEEAEPSPSNF